MLHVLLTRGDLPFDETKILAGECPEFVLLPEIWGGVAEEGAELCQGLLQHNPEQRPRANDCLTGVFVGGEAEKLRVVRPAKPLTAPLKNQFTNFSQRRFLAPGSEANRVVVTEDLLGNYPNSSNLVFLSGHSLGGPQRV